MERTYCPDLKWCSSLHDGMRKLTLQVDHLHLLFLKQQRLLLKLGFSARAWGIRFGINMRSGIGDWG